MSDLYPGLDDRDAATLVVNAAYLEHTPVGHGHDTTLTALSNPEQGDGATQGDRLVEGRAAIAAIEERGGYSSPSPARDRDHPVCAESLGYQRKQVQVARLIEAYRAHGHLAAWIDPLGEQAPDPPPELTLAYHDLTVDDLALVFDSRGLIAPIEAPLGEIEARLKAIYCGPIGSEYLYLPDNRERAWLRAQIEGAGGHPAFSPLERRRILERLVAAEGLERYLHTRYVGQKRFSLEGAETLIPMLDELVQRAGSQGVQEVILGMAHRGRLNVLINILGRPAQDLFDEFEGKSRLGRGTGDVKYHRGFSADIHTPDGPVHVVLAFNPSHLEIVNPVVEGSVRARQERRRDATGDQVLPVLIHGDAAFAGQGVVMETLNMAATRGFTTHGSLHIVVNNQIGFTTSTRADARSTAYCTAVATMVAAPIFHVNADAPEAAVFVLRQALDYRQTFHRDVVIDLVCYRRFGHNEADEPAATQPMMYRRIKSLPTTLTQYQTRLIEAGVIAPEEALKRAENKRTFQSLR